MSQGGLHQNISEASNEFSAEKNDLALYGSPMQIRQNRNARRASSFVKMATEDQNLFEGNHRPARLTRSDARRGSSFIRTLSEDNTEDNRYLGKNLKPEVRRGSSLFAPQEEDHLYASRTPKDIRRGSSFIRTSDDSLEEGRKLDVRRGSSFIRMVSEDINSEEMHSTGRLSRPESRRGSSFVKMMSDDTSEDSSRRSSRDMRRGSSFVRMVFEENDGDDNLGKSMDRPKPRSSVDSSSTYRNSLGSISEYKTFSSDYATKSTIDNNEDNTDRMFINSSLSYLSWIESVNSSDCISTAPVTDNDNRFGEWNSFWTNYNSSRNEYYSSPYLCPSNSGEDLSLVSNGSTQRGYTDKSATENIVLTAEEANEALNCAQRLLDILRVAIKRSEADIVTKNDENNVAKEEQNPIDDGNTQKEKNLFKSSNNCIDVILNHTGVADILKRVINKRRDVIMPPEEISTPKSSVSEWSVPKK